MNRWLALVGIGEDGIDGLSPDARARIDTAEILVGGARHLAFVPPSPAERVLWAKPFRESFAKIEKLRGRRVTVLASGEPLWFGVGAKLAALFGPAEIEIHPHVGAFSLAAARLAWPMERCAFVSVHGRDLDTLARHLHPRSKLLILSADANSPSAIASYLTARGFGDSALAVFERMGGKKEKRLDGRANAWPHAPGDDLNLVAVDCVAGAQARWQPCVGGLPDDAFEHDGQLTKREARALTLAHLAPFPGALLWDVGAGNGSVGIEWMRAAPRARAFAIERDTERAARIAINARALGVPEIEIVTGEAPAALAGLPAPDAVFVGGGLSNPALIEACWAALPAGGVFAANAVTLEGETVLAELHKRWGGETARLAASRAEKVGPYRGWRPSMQVTLFRVVKT
jgi:precorrin-6B C5,15-methyltransferase / cobalt-precorrin-6B C5,C15-methyltransferase